MYTVDIYIHALLVHERITMPTQTALRVRGDKAASLQLAEKVSMLQLNNMHNSLLHKAWPRKRGLGYDRGYKTLRKELTQQQQ